jgi:hypothetical protein
MDNANLGTNDIDMVLKSLGNTYSDIRRECLTECANLFDTHELTLAEKSCSKNCFKKLGYAYKNFQELVAKNYTKINNLKE